MTIVIAYFLNPIKINETSNFHSLQVLMSHIGKELIIRNVTGAAEKGVVPKTGHALDVAKASQRAVRS